ncbi:transposase [Clostridium sp. WILCCON 0269]|uniref:Transposase n=1 Tax=Candidatus Clostridium eludens TaxID=3381663 RepID=A0ABW8SG04_9CLOT
MSQDYPDKRVIIIADNARYHHFKGINQYLEELKNIEFLYLPSYCSQLNAIEHLWKSIRSNVTHNTLFNNFSDLLQQITSYLSSIKEDKTTLKKLCAYIH